MNERQVLTPTSDHPITVEPTGDRVVVRAGSVIIADTDDALTLRESGYSPVHYIPLADVDEGALRPSDHQSYCPYKGDAAYYDLSAGGMEAEHAVWTYREPFDAVAPIAGHVAFYPEHVEILVGDGIAED